MRRDVAQEKARRPIRLETMRLAPDEDSPIVLSPPPLQTHRFQTFGQFSSRCRCEIGKLNQAVLRIDEVGGEQFNNLLTRRKNNSRRALFDCASQLSAAEILSDRSLSPGK